MTSPDGGIMEFVTGYQQKHCSLNTQMTIATIQVYHRVKEHADQVLMCNFIVMQLKIRTGVEFRDYIL